MWVVLIETKSKIMILAGYSFVVVVQTLIGCFSAVLELHLSQLIFCVAKSKCYDFLYETRYSSILYIAVDDGEK